MITPIGQGAKAGATPQTSSATGLSSLGAGDFLNLLVAQLTHQDPTNPMDPTQMVSQTATLTMVQDMTEMNQAISTLGANQAMQSAVSMISHSVTYQLAGASSPQTGTVTSVAVSGGNPALVIDGNQVPLSAVVAVG